MGPQRAELLQKELNIFTFNDLLHYFPFRHVDKTKLTPIGEINLNDEYVQVAGILAPLEQMGEKRGRRLTSYLQDKTGSLDLVWFQSINLIKKIVHPGQPYLVYGKVSFFMGKPQMVHPEMEPWDPEN